MRKYQLLQGLAAYWSTLELHIDPFFWRALKQLCEDSVFRNGLAQMGVKVRSLNDSGSRYGDEELYDDIIPAAERNALLCLLSPRYEEPHIIDQYWRTQMLEQLSKELPEAELDWLHQLVVRLERLSAELRAAAAVPSPTSLS